MLFSCAVVNKTAIFLGTFIGDSDDDLPGVIDDDLPGVIDDEPPGSVDQYQYQESPAPSPQGLEPRRLFDDSDSDDESDEDESDEDESDEDEEIY